MPGDNITSGLDFWSPVSQPAEHTDEQGSIADFWLPASLFVDKSEWSECKPSASEPLQTELCDFWALDQEQKAPDEQLDDWAQTHRLPWFDSELGYNPYQVSIEPPSERLIAEKRGRWLSQLLDIPEQRRRIKYATFFGEVFDQFPAQANFRLLSALALEGVPAEPMLNGCAFKLSFLITPIMASRRSARALSPQIPADHQMSLSWRRAIRISQLCGGGNPDDYIDQDWYLEWLNLPIDNELFWVYLDYIEWRLRSASLGYMHPYYGDHLKRERDDVLRGWGLGRLGSRSRTWELVDIRADHVGVLHPEKRTPNVLKWRTLGNPRSGRELLDKEN
ncbi:hypothetical protein NKI32_03125 [Mesorhizobium sp. M0761]|uniref:hypothetical protein n=1 Tax=Mesorhizobium sp. M0761 TaxID=2956994 RepID=UPI00333C1CA1